MKMIFDILDYCFEKKKKNNKHVQGVLVFTEILQYFI